MIEKKVKGVSHYEFVKLSKFKEIIHFISSRENGNMSFKNSDAKDVKQNLENFLNAFNISLKKCVFAQQIHTDNVRIITSKTKTEEVAQGVYWVLETDSMITAEKNTCLIIKTSDCIPNLIYDPVNKVIAAVHSGWKGCLANIVGKTVIKMQKEFDTDPRDLIVGMGPSIGSEDCFVRQDVYDLFTNGGYTEYLKFASPDQWLLDLWNLNRDNLIKSGVEKENIELSNISTYTSDKFYSYRMKSPEGHFITGIMLK